MTEQMTKPEETVRIYQSIHHPIMNNSTQTPQTAAEEQLETTVEATSLGASTNVHAPQKAPPASAQSFLPCMPPLTLAARPIGAMRQIPKDLFYCRANRYYYMKMPDGGWSQLNMGRIVTHLKQTYGLSTASVDGEQSEVDEVIYRVEQFRTVDMVGRLAGYSEGFVQQDELRFLVTSSPDLIAPEPGDWSMLEGVMKNLLGEVQLPYFYGWLKVALQMFESQTWMAGQVVALCGPPQAGKNLLTYLVQKLFGCRAPGKPYDYMTKGTTFNADLIGAELLTIEDEISHTDLKTRRAFGARIKDLAVNKTRRLHKKYVDGAVVNALQRLIISLNDEPERVLILPPIDDDVADKIMIFKVERHEMPMPTDTPQAEKAFGDALVAQLPAFVHFLREWEIPEDLRSNRCGVIHYHHPDILLMLNAQSPETKLMTLIDDIVFAGRTNPWQGKAIDLERLLVGTPDNTVQREVRKLLASNNSCGRYLARLAAKNGNRVIQHPGHAGIHNWTIHPPHLAAGSACPEVGGDLKQKLLEMVRSTQPGAVAPQAGEQDMAA